MDRRHSDSLVTRLGLSNAKPAITPGSKDCGKNCNLEVLGASSHHEYRGGAGIAHYMAEHRIDQAFATKEIMRDASAPTNCSQQRLKRLGRYVRGRPLCRIRFPWCKFSGILEEEVDSDWAGEVETHKSTSGGAVLHCGHLIRHWCSTQPTLSLSSGESEAKAITRGAVEGIYMKHVLEQQGYVIEVVIKSDASAAIGMLTRLGTGKKVRHLEVQHLWLQQVSRQKLVRCEEISTHENRADILTKHLARDLLDRFLCSLNISFPGADVDVMEGLQEKDDFKAVSEEEMRGLSEWGLKLGLQLNDLTSI